MRQQTWNAPWAGIRLGVALILAAIVAAAAPSPARADCTAKNKKKIKRYIKGAMDDFDLLEIDAALRKLKKAIEYGEDKDCETTLEYASALLSRGIVHWRGQRDKTRCTIFMTKALKANPCVKMNANMPPKVQRIWKDVKKNNPNLKCRGGTTTRPPPRRVVTRPPPRRVVTRPPPARKIAFGEPPSKPCEHRVIDEVSEGSPINVLVKVQGNLGAAKVVVYYRPQGQASYLKLFLKKHSNGWAWTGLIPSVHVQGKRLAYFIEVQNAGGTAICAPIRATSSAPEVIMITKAAGGAKPGCNEELPDEVCRLNPNHPCCNKAKPPPVVDPKGKFDRFYINVGFSLGLGYLSTGMQSDIATNDRDPACTPAGCPPLQPQVAGFALGGIGAHAELGIFATRKILISLAGKFGNVLTDVSTTPVLSLQVLARFKYYVLGGKGELVNFYLGAQIGYAGIFHSLAVTNDNPPKRDTFSHGDASIGAIVGLQLGGKKVGWFIELDPGAVLPRQSTFHMSLTTGVAFRFWKF